MMDNKTCSVDILGVSLGEEGYLIIPRQTRELCEPLVKAADALEKALDDLPVDVTDEELCNQDYISLLRASIGLRGL